MSTALAVDNAAGREMLDYSAPAIADETDTSLVKPQRLASPRVSAPRICDDRTLSQRVKPIKWEINILGFRSTCCFGSALPDASAYRVSAFLQRRADKLGKVTHLSCVVKLPSAFLYRNSNCRWMCDQKMAPATHEDELPWSPPQPRWHR